MAPHSETNGTFAKISEMDMAKSMVDTSLEAIPITKALAEFVANLTYESIDSETLHHLKRFLLDCIGVAAYAAATNESSEPFVRAMLKFGSNACGNSTVLTKGSGFLPQYASLLNGAFIHTLDFDDTFAAGALHPGAPVVPAALAQAEASGANGKTLLTALAAGYEVVCRISKATSTGAYEREFHNTGTVGIFGAIAAIMKIKGDDASKIEAAFGLAGSKAAGSMQFLENGAWNKRLHPGFAAHDALLCVSLVDEGVLAASKPLEGIFGYLKGYSGKFNIEGIIDGLGKDWTLVTTAIKPYPGCRMTHTAIDMAAIWRKKKTVPIKSLKLSLSPHCWMTVGRRLSNKIHPQNIVDAQFSAYYQLAVAWLDGNENGWKVYDRIQNKDVVEFTDKITVESADDLVGLAGRLEMTWEDGTTEIDVEKHPVGEPSNPLTDEQLLKKFKSMANPVYGEQQAAEVAKLVNDIEGCKNATELMSLLA